MPGPGAVGAGRASSIAGWPIRGPRGLRIHARRRDAGLPGHLRPHFIADRPSVPHRATCGGDARRRADARARRPHPRPGSSRDQPRRHRAPRRHDAPRLRARGLRILRSRFVSDCGSGERLLRAMDKGRRYAAENKAEVLQFAREQFSVQDISPVEADYAYNERVVGLDRVAWDDFDKLARWMKEVGMAKREFEPKGFFDPRPLLNVLPDRVSREFRW